jgi:ABC-type amino acid transport substrate-binding protein
VVGPVLLSWTTEDLPQQNLSFEVSLTPAGKPPILQRTARNSIPLQGIEGKVEWKVRPVWQMPGQRERFGEWSDEQSFTYYPSTLDRIVATRTVHVGIAEPDGFFVQQEGGELTGYEIELLRGLVTQILAARGVSAKPTITYTRTIWGEELFRLLERDGAVDLIASAISVTPAREKTYGLLFTQPTLVFSQTLITKPGVKVFVNGKLALSRVGVVEKTTNEDLARKLAGPTASKSVVVPYKGSGAYERILADLVAERIDGALIDKPYAVQKAAVLKQENGQDLALTDITAKIVPGIELEKMGFAVRKSDRAFLQELNARLTGAGAARDGILSKSIPGWSR